MSDNEEDKKTVVLNLEELKRLKNLEENPIENVDLEFSSNEEMNSNLLILFDYQSNLFKENLDLFSKIYQTKLVNDLVSLNQQLTMKANHIVLFNYSAAPNAVNQLCAQIKKKYPNVKTVITALNLSEEKAQSHMNSESGANSYLSYPFDFDKVKNILNKL